jgi:hypothetical protein
MAPRGAHAARYPGRVSLRRDCADLSVQRWLEDLVSKGIGGRGSDCARHVERPRAGGENGRECGVGAKEVAALTPLIALVTAI